MRVSMIVAVADSNVIGGDNRLLWHLPADLAHFKRTTLGHHIIMGRRTYEAIGRPLPGRTNVVLTRDDAYTVEGVTVARSIEAALEIAAAADDTEPFIIGGGAIYEQALPLTERVYLTRVHAAFDGDTFFPQLDPEEWTTIESESFAADAKNPYDYEFITLERGTRRR